MRILRSMGVLFLSLLCWNGAEDARATDAPRAVDQDQGDTDSDQLIATIRLNILPGLSNWAGAFPQPTSANPLRILYQVEPSCPSSPGVNVSVLHADTGLWERTKFDGRYDHHSGGVISGIRFDFSSNYLRSITCTFNIYASGNSVTPPNPPAGEGEIVGAVQYQGGFTQAADLELAETAVVNQIEVLVPEFCEGVEILELGTVIDGTYFRAKPVAAGSRRYSVNNGAGFPTKGIRLTLNGPQSLACALPVKIFRQTAATDAE